MEIAFIGSPLLSYGIQNKCESSILVWNSLIQFPNMTVRPAISGLSLGWLPQLSVNTGSFVFFFFFLSS